MDRWSSSLSVAGAHSSQPKYCGIDTHIDVVSYPSSQAMASRIVGMPTGPLYSWSMLHWQVLSETSTGNGLVCGQSANMAPSVMMRSTSNSSATCRLSRQYSSHR